MANWLRSLLTLSFLCLFLTFIIVGCGDIEGEIASLTISPASLTIGINKSQVFTATAKDSYGIIVQASPTWSISGNIGAISQSGLFVAGADAAVGYVMASYEGKTASTMVTVTDTGWLTGRIQSTYVDFGYLEGIRVYLKDTSFSDYSDSNGRYTISNIPAGTYEVWTDATVTFKASSMEVTIGRGETVTRDIVLETQPGVTTTTTTLFSL